MTKITKSQSNNILYHSSRQQNFQYSKRSMALVKMCPPARAAYAVYLPPIFVILFTIILSSIRLIIQLSCQILSVSGAFILLSPEVF